MLDPPLRFGIKRSNAQASADPLLDRQDPSEGDFGVAAIIREAEPTAE